MSDENTETSARSATPVRATAAKSAPGKPEIQTMARVRMNTSMAGFTPIPAKDDAGKPIYSSTTGKPVMVNGPEFVRLPDRDYDIPVEEAERLIEAGYATKASAAA